MPHRIPGAPPRLDGFSCIRPLGAGGFADVFLCEQDLPLRQVAVKVLRSEALTPDGFAAFRSEADLLAALGGGVPVVSLYEVGICDGGRPYLAMEYCPGRLRVTPEPFEAVRAVALVIPVAGAVAELHRLGAVHRDLKPGNVFLTGEGAPRLGDFGLAVRLSGLADAPVGVSGRWTAPEVRSGVSCGSPAADVWSLGRILEVLLSGSRGRIRPRELPDGLRDILVRATRRNAGERYPDAGALVSDLKSWAARSASRSERRRSS
ncbi:MAG: serine/threonine protein kinase [Microbacteriaceae bacterium]|jgi:serine/threonine protein kinase|nr:serine/threonine protein kinase [Microbacteriaceae bacterium]MCI1206895.1 serine/threonine protein kinase [Microbacteriaceae bacterium]